jgi:uncharacterized membrane protein YdjX (TVP38/TMEM64 family)
LDASKAIRPLRPRSNLRTNLLRVLSLVIVIGVTVGVYTYRGHIAQFRSWGYPGIFLISLLSNATMLLPAPGIAFVFAMGSVLPVWGVALVAGTGAALGELTGYLAGFSGQAVVERSDTYNRIAPWVARSGGWAILVLAAIPNPFFDMAGIAAGASGMPVWRFFAFCWVGQVIKMSAFALAGAYSITWFTGLFH